MLLHSQLLIITCVDLLFHLSIPSRSSTLLGSTPCRRPWDQSLPAGADVLLLSPVPTALLILLTPSTNSIAASLSCSTSASARWMNFLLVVRATLKRMLLSYSLGTFHPALRMTSIGSCNTLHRMLRSPVTQRCAIIFFCLVYFFHTHVHFHTLFLPTCRSRSRTTESKSTAIATSGRVDVDLPAQCQSPAKY